MLVTTRTISLASVPHSSFALRFSDLNEIEAACREDEEQRAVRTMDWVAARVNNRCAKWIEDAESPSDMESLRTPWWDELRHCTEGDHVPSKSEGWNHPVAVILAVSTTAPNPLQAITALQSRSLDFPSWVDTTLFQYTLIVHPQNSPLSTEEAGALFNAVKKQYGLHSYLLQLALPSPSPPPVPVPPLVPRLPPTPESLIIDSSNHEPSSSDVLTRQHVVNTLRLSESDIQQTARFSREFVVMSLVPWMEKCVLEWNEHFSSTRRLPSRLFSSTRRLFGSPSSSPAPSHNVSSSISSLSSRTSYSSTGQPSMTSPPSQQRRLAEFATILGDFKLAITVWEALRKDGKGGADILPILLTPSPAISSYVSNALSSIHPSSSELPPKAQLRALVYAVRWAAGIPSSDFLGDILDGERWLVWAAGDTEEPTSALLLAHAALLSARKGSKRRAALWYLVAANKLEKSGIKPLTMYFLRKAHALYLTKPPKPLSPSFWDSECRTPDDVGGFDAILAGIEHPLGRLLYTTGDILGAVKMFIGLLRRAPSPPEIPPSGSKPPAEDLVPDKLFLEDFRVALTHLKSTSKDRYQLDDLKLPVRFCLIRQARIRSCGDCVGPGDEIWEKREKDWLFYGPSNEALQRSGSTYVGETFWIDLVVQNPLFVEVNLSRFTVVIQEENDSSTAEALVEIQVIDQIFLEAKEKRTISVSVKPQRPASLIFTAITYDFLSLLPSSESLSYRGRRLQTAVVQKQDPTYASDIHLKTEVAAADHRLLATFDQDEESAFLQGEYKCMRLSLTNIGTKPITEVWIVSDAEDHIWLDQPQYACSQGVTMDTEVTRSLNSLVPHVIYRIPQIDCEHSPLLPGGSRQISVTLHVQGSGKREIALLLTFRENSQEPFQSVRLSKNYEAQALFDLGAAAHPCTSTNTAFILNLELTNNHATHVVQLVQVSTLSPAWRCTSLAQEEEIGLHPSQTSRLLFNVFPWENASGAKDTLEFVSEALSDVIHGCDSQARKPPPIDILCCHVNKVEDLFSVGSPMIQHFIECGRRQIISQTVGQLYSGVPSHLRLSIFPLYNPFAVDIVVFWRIPSQNRTGHVLISGVTLGARHAALDETIRDADKLKNTRSIYAETRREKMEILNAVKNDEWNAEMDPLSIVVQDPQPIKHDFSKG
ncbi:hypothetical protein AX17_000241 [Amanita inopinata Kibby_2008]|nr:hypothetical protein AX17_000241 [Amanita inopinata Kibby_2008]